MPRINYFINNKKIINSLIKINDIDHKKIESVFDYVNILDFNENSSHVEFLSNHSNNLVKYKNFIEDKFENLCLSINSHHLYKSAYSSNPKIKNKNKVNKIFNHRIETIIFSDMSILFDGFYSSAAGKGKN